MDKRKVGNTKQVISAYNLELKDGASYGKQCVLVHNGGLEVMFNADNALDIAWIKFNGVNISFLSKNGLNSNDGEFRNKFDGGFLYTCGLDNVSACEKDKAVHGSLHYRKASNVGYVIDDEKVTVSGTIYNTALFGENLIFKRNYTVYNNKVEVSDIIENAGYKDASYALIYHVNYGYPFLDSSLELDFDAKQTLPANAKSKDTINDCKIITEPLDDGSEDLFYHVLNQGKVTLCNKVQGVKCVMDFDTNKLPYLLEWKNLFSGDYALGIEPSTTRFDEYKKVTLKPAQQEKLGFTVTFEEV